MYKWWNIHWHVIERYDDTQWKSRPEKRNKNKIPRGSRIHRDRLFFSPFVSRPQKGVQPQENRKKERLRGHGDYLSQLHLLVDTGRARFNFHRPPPRTDQVTEPRVPEPTKMRGDRCITIKGGRLENSLVEGAQHNARYILIDAYTWNKL